MGELRCFLKSFTFAGRGFYHSLKTGRNLRFQLSAFFLAAFLGLITGLSAAEWCALFLISAVILSGELFNTAIERAVDIVSPDWNKRAGFCKDAAAAAVLVSSVCGLCIGLLLFLSHGRPDRIITYLLNNPLIAALLALYLLGAGIFTFKKRGD